MSDSALNRFLASGTAAERAAFTPSVPSPASGPDPLYLWLETDTGELWAYAGGAWVQVTGSAALSTAQRTRTITFPFDNGSSDLTAGTTTIPISAPWTGTITGAKLLSPQTGAIVLDVWKDTYGNNPPTVADTITASAKPTLSAANSADDTTLTGWTTAVTAGDVFIANVDSCTGIHACSLQLTVVIT